MIKSTMNEAPKDCQRCMVWDVAKKEWLFAYWVRDSFYRDSGVSIHGDLWQPEPLPPKTKEE